MSFREFLTTTLRLMNYAAPRNDKRAVRHGLARPIFNIGKASVADRTVCSQLIELIAPRALMIIRLIRRQVSWAVIFHIYIYIYISFKRKGFFY